MRQAEPARRMEESWREQRAYLQQAIAALGDSPEAEVARQSLREVLPRPMETSKWQQIKDPGRSFETDHLTLGIDKQSGAINFLMCKASGQQWASNTHMLGQVCYEVFAQSDYERFWTRYIRDNAETRSWARKDFTKPGIEHAIKAHHSWQTRLIAAYEQQDEEHVSFLLVMTLPEQASILGAPRTLTLEVIAPRAEPILLLNLQWTEKQASRLPEALWCSFQPATTSMQGWSFSKVGTVLSPLEVVSRGNRTLHAIHQEVRYTGEEGAFQIETLDAPLMAPGRPSLLDFADTQPEMSGGIHFNLYNNVWGTNFPMWYEEDARFRFRLRFL
ncbi:MAG TPA: DUF5054 domain-containing protein [Ktedonobacteraceae bacterium]|nr:DUF5054 domain-containing protein [Ktedonobacteraceae bacterium]